jgi:predicted transcriptional regulator
MKPFIKNSVLAVKILSCAKDETYSQEIADKLDTTSSSIRRTVGDLYEIGFLEKTERKKAQHFRIDYSGIRDFWVNEVRKSLQEIIDNERFEVEEMTLDAETGEKGERVKMKVEDGHYRIGANPSELLQQLDEMSEKDLDLFFEFYISNYLDHTSDSTIEDMLFQDLFQSIIRLDSELYPEAHTSLPEDLNLIRQILRLYVGVPAHLAVKSKFEELLTEPELSEKDTFTSLLSELKEQNHDTTGYTVDDLENYYFARGKSKNNN